MWLPKTLYEAVPYFLMTAGLLAMAASLGGALYLGYWYGGAALYFGGGCLSLIVGAAVWQMRRDYRARSKWQRHEHSQQ